jgi:hypothetical protein
VLDSLDFNAIMGAALQWANVLKVPFIAIVGIFLALGLAERVIGLFIRKRPPTDGGG